MKDEARQTRSHLMALFRDHGFHPRSGLGQNFLIDLNLVEFIVRAADLSDRDLVLEVGAGTGGMTTILADQAGHVISVEIDRNMFALATHATRNCANVTLISRDILKNKNTLAPEITDEVRQELAARSDRRLKLVANLPYSVATPVISNLVASDLPWERIVATIQLELAEKMIAQPHASGYGALSVWLQSQSSVRILRRLRPQVFWPRPKVHSAIVSLWRHDDRAGRISDRPFFLDFVRRLFHHRRKLMRGVLYRMYRRQLSKSEVDAILADLGHTANSRAEQLDVAQLIRLANRFCRRILGQLQMPATDVTQPPESKDSCEGVADLEPRTT